MSDYMKEVERLLDQYNNACLSIIDMTEWQARAALLAHIQRGAPAPAGVPMPKPVAYGFGNTAITGHTNRLMMVRIDIPGGDQYAGAFWLPLVLADEAHTYGVACRAAGEAAGYARGLRDAVRDAKEWGNALNDAGWAFDSAYHRHMGEPTPPRLFNTAKTILRDAIIAYTAALRGDVKP